MQNRIAHIFGDDADGRAAGDRVWEFDHQPGLRLAWLFVLMVLPVAVVSLRLVHLQVFLADDFVVDFDWTTKTREPIPSRDGRILSADGTVLAEDAVHFDIWMHYRWLEDPPDAAWLKQQALARLSRRERRDKNRVEQSKQTVLRQRKEMWQRLAEITGTPAAELTLRRNAIQERVERIVASVERRRRDKDAQAAQTASQSEDVTSMPAWQRAFYAVKTALTTPPRRIEQPLEAVTEELQYHPLVEHVPLAVTAEIEAQPSRYPGLTVRTSTSRVYPQHALASLVIGTRLPLDDAQWQQRREKLHGPDPLDYRPGDRIGRNGVERAYDGHLHALRGERAVITDRRGQIIKTEIVRHPRNGEDVELTLHIPLQKRIEELLDKHLETVQQQLKQPQNPARNNTGNDEHDSDNVDEETQRSEPLPRPGDGSESAGAAAVVLDIHSGAVLAAASAPHYDLDLFIHPDLERWNQAQADPRRPFFARATQMSIPPGSVFKTLSAVAVLESGKIDPDSPFACRGFLGDDPRRFRCYVYQHFGTGHGDTTLSDALCRSCNVYFFHAADVIGGRAIVDWGKRFGIGQPTGIDLPGESAGNLPELGPSSAAAGGRGATRISGETRGLAIGQSRLTATPLQIARLMAAVANDGNLVTPRIARIDSLATEDDAARDLPDAHRPQRISGLSYGTLQRVREGLERVVAHPQGTGYKNVRMSEIAIAGKTGTAEVGGGKRDHAWFAGYVPADQPRYAFVVVLEHAGSGGTQAGPVARDLVRALLAEGLLSPTTLTRRD